MIAAGCRSRAPAARSAPGEGAHHEHMRARPCPPRLARRAGPAGCPASRPCSSQSGLHRLVESAVFQPGRPPLAGAVDEPRRGRAAAVAGTRSRTWRSSRPRPATTTSPSDAMQESKRVRHREHSPGGGASALCGHRSPAAGPTAAGRHRSGCRRGRRRPRRCGRGSTPSGAEAAAGIGARTAEGPQQGRRSLPPGQGPGPGTRTRARRRKRPRRRSAAASWLAWTVRGPRGGAGRRSSTRRSSGK